MGSHSRRNETKPRKRRFNGNHYKQTGRRGTSEVTQQQQEPQQQHSSLLLTDNTSDPGSNKSQPATRNAIRFGQEVLSLGANTEIST